METEERILELLSRLKPITLEQMSGIRLMNRTDTKFVTSKENLVRLLAMAQGKYYAQYYPLDGLTQVRIVHQKDRSEPLKMLEITVMTPGQLPENFQLWEDPPEKVDMMVLHGHPDDEILWFGGLLPTYGGQ